MTIRNFGHCLALAVVSLNFACSPTLTGKGINELREQLSSQDSQGINLSQSIEPAPIRDNGARGVVGFVRQILPTSDGGLLFTGYMTGIGVQPAASILALDPVTLKPQSVQNFRVNGSVNFIRQYPGSQLLIAGQYTEYNSELASALVRVSENGSRDTTFVANLRAASPYAAPAVNDLHILNDGKILIVGIFYVVSDDGQRTENIALLNPDGSLDQQFLKKVGSGPNGYTLNAIESIDGSKFFIGGEFTRWNGSESPDRLLVIDSAGNLDDALNLAIGTGFSSAVTDLTRLPNGEVVLVGNQNLSANLGATRGVVWLSNDMSVNSVKTGALAPGIEGIGQMNRIQLYGANRLMLKGARRFTIGSAHLPVGIAVLNFDGSLDQTFHLRYQDQLRQFSGDVKHWYPLDNQTALLGGGIYRAGPTGSGFAVLNSQTGAIDPRSDVLGAGISGDIHHIFSVGAESVLIAGRFTGWNWADNPIKGILKLDAQGRLDQDFYSNFRVAGDVQAIVQLDGKIIFDSRHFESPNGLATHSGLKRVLVNGEADPGFVPLDLGGFDANRRLALDSQGRILVAGRMMSVLLAGQARWTPLLRLMPDGSLDEAFTSSVVTNVLPAMGGADLQALTIADNDRVIIGGRFNFVPGGGLTSVRNIMAITSSGAPDEAFNAGFGGRITDRVRKLATQPDGKILLGGDFLILDGNFGLLGSSFVRLNSDGQIDEPFLAAVNRNTSITFLNDFWLGPSNQIYLSISRTSRVGGEQARSHFVSLDFNGEIDIARQGRFNFNGAPFAFGVWKGDNIVYGQFNEVNGTLQPELVKMNNQGNVDSSKWIHADVPR